MDSSSKKLRREFGQEKDLEISVEKALGVKVLQLTRSEDALQQAKTSVTWYTAECEERGECEEGDGNESEVEEDESESRKRTRVSSTTRIHGLVHKQVDTTLEGKYRSASHRRMSQLSFQVEAKMYSRVLPDLTARFPHARSPKAYSVESSEEGDKFSFLLEDLGSSGGASGRVGGGGGGEHHLCLDMQQTKTAVDWLACMHAAYWNSEVSSREGLWEDGGYWTLNKRESDLDKIESDWEVTLSNWAPDLDEQGDFGKALRRCARPVSRHLSSRWPQHRTLIHGDFKTANLFFFQSSSPSSSSSATGGMAVVDWQWAGGGLAVQDLTYLLHTSCDLQVLEAEDEVLQYYHSRLHSYLQQTDKQVDDYDLDVMMEQYQLATVDYTRFLVGSMWARNTPQSCKEFAQSLNQGMHKRSADHFLRMVRRSASLLRSLESGSLLSSHQRGAKANPDIGGAVTKPTPLIGQVLSASLYLASEVAAVVKDIYSSGDLKVKEKGQEAEGITDPQTEADRRSERITVGTLRHCFPGLSVIGEEDTTEFEAEDILTPPLDMIAHWEMPEDLLNARVEDLTVWVDPLDGTREFVDGIPSAVTVLIGIALKGKPVAGVIHQPWPAEERSRAGVKLDERPSSGRTVWGGVGLGVWGLGPRFPPISIVPTQGSQARKGSENGLIVATSRSHSSQAVADAALRVEPVEVVPLGGAGGKVVKILDREVDSWIYAASGTKRWDTCAAEALLLASGGFIVKHKTGEQYDYASVNQFQPRNTGGVVAALGGYNIYKKAFEWEV